MHICVYSNMTHLHSHIYSQTHTCTSPLCLIIEFFPGQLGPWAPQISLRDSLFPLLHPQGQAPGYAMWVTIHLKEQAPQTDTPSVPLHNSHTTHGWARESLVACLTLRASGTLGRKQETVTWSCGLLWSDGTTSSERSGQRDKAGFSAPEAGTLLSREQVA